MDSKLEARARHLILSIRPPLIHVSLQFFQLRQQPLLEPLFWTPRRVPQPPSWPVSVPGRRKDLHPMENMLQVKRKIVDQAVPFQRGYQDWRGKEGEEGKQESKYMLGLFSSNPSTMHLRRSPSSFMRCYLIFHVLRRLNRHTPFVTTRRATVISLRVLYGLRDGIYLLHDTPKPLT